MTSFQPAHPGQAISGVTYSCSRPDVAVQRAILIAIWQMATTETPYIDPGGDYFTRLNPEKARTKAIRQLEAMRGYNVTLEQAS